MIKSQSTRLDDKFFLVVTVRDRVPGGRVILGVGERDLVGLVVALIWKLLEVQMQLQILVLLDRVDYHAPGLPWQDRKSYRRHSRY